MGCEERLGQRVASGPAARLAGIQSGVCHRHGAFGGVLTVGAVLSVAKLRWGHMIGCHSAHQVIIEENIVCHHTRMEGPGS
jgi:hypothetical protein